MADKSAKKCAKSIRIRGLPPETTQPDLEAMVVGILKCHGKLVSSQKPPPRGRT